MFDPNADKLGIAVEQRGLQHRRQYEQNAIHDNPFADVGRVLPDANMTGWLQALQESAGNKSIRMGQDAERSHGLADDPDWWASGDAGAHQALPGANYGESTSFGSHGAYDPTNRKPTSSLNVLMNTTRGLR